MGRCNCFYLYEKKRPRKTAGNRKKDDFSGVSVLAYYMLKGSATYAAAGVQESIWYSRCKLMFQQLLMIEPYFNYINVSLMDLFKSALNKVVS